MARVTLCSLAVDTVDTDEEAWIDRVWHEAGNDDMLDDPQHQVPEVCMFHQKLVCMFHQKQILKFL